ncbi:MAG: dTMP kinase [Atopobium sp.]|uniref:dTMP kinase n=1 Tax=Atopobium sp. TaxID=1872650 RepID=UPI002A82C36F|nr:dTMP kinase [Atopobium sp.]MDY4522069.1 dTMP kinase [Atopobium sp.]
MAGVFITFEGIDGCGKTTQVQRVYDTLLSAGMDVIRLREPGGTRISEAIRAVLLDKDNAEMCDECELLLYEASRAQMVKQVVEPALAAGTIVLCDRFYDSTFAYQAGGRGINAQRVQAANKLGSCGVDPTRTLILDIDPREGFARATKGGADRLEAEGLMFQTAVRKGYLTVAQENPQRAQLVNASGSPDEVYQRICDALSDLIPQLGA